ncbi:hypothetical protein D3C77_656430 [compost metagenome]
MIIILMNLPTSYSTIDDARKEKITNRSDTTLPIHTPSSESINSTNVRTESPRRTEL